MLIALSGLASAGKDTVADHLAKNYGVTRVGFADPIKRIAKELFAFSDEQLWGPSAERNRPDKRYPREHHDRHDWVEVPRGWRCGRCGQDNESHDLTCTVYLTPRFFLQHFGTETGRACYPKVWVDYALRVAHELLASSRENERVGDVLLPEYSAQLGVTYRAGIERTRGVVITDARFANELVAVKAAGGRLVRIVRPEAGLEGTAGQHSSEEEQKTIPNSTFDLVLNNDSTLKALYSSVDATIGRWLDR